MKIAISAESTIDLPQNLLEKFDIHTTPFTINLDEQVIPDEQGVSSKIYDFVEKTKTLPKTSAVNQIQFEEHFASLYPIQKSCVPVRMPSDRFHPASQSMPCLRSQKPVLRIQWEQTGEIHRQKEYPAFQ